MGRSQRHRAVVGATEESGGRRTPTRPSERAPERVPGCRLVMLLLLRWTSTGWAEWPAPQVTPTTRPNPRRLRLGAGSSPPRSSPSPFRLTAKGTWSYVTGQVKGESTCCACPRPSSHRVCRTLARGACLTTQSRFRGSTSRTVYEARAAIQDGDGFLGLRTSRRLGAQHRRADRCSRVNRAEVSESAPRNREAWARCHSRRGLLSNGAAADRCFRRHEYLHGFVER